MTHNHDHVTPLDHAKAMVDALAREITVPHGERVRHLLFDAQAALIYAVDEIEQLREDRAKAVRSAIKLATRIADLEEEISERESADRLIDQHLDYHLASR